jgi:hypothetical protein
MRDFVVSSSPPASARSRALAVAATLALAVLLPLARPGYAYKRLVERDDFLLRPAFGLVAGVGTYRPASAASGGLQLSTGIRYIRPDIDDDTWHSLGAELLVCTWSSSSEDILTLQGNVLMFWPRTTAFTFDHHFFVGAGLGTSQVDRFGSPDLNVQTANVEGGLQGRIRDWYMELHIRYLLGPRRTAYDVSGYATQLAATYHFDL